MVILDGSVGQMMEPAELPEMRPIVRKDWDWAVGGKGSRGRRILTSIYLDPPQEERANYRMLQTWQTIQQNEVRYKEYYLEDAEFVVVGFGPAARVALSAVSPFPFEVLDRLAAKATAFLVVEMNQGQMLNDVQLAVKGRIPVEFYGRPGGMTPFPDEILKEIKRMTTTKLKIVTDPRVAWLQRTLA